MSEEMVFLLPNEVKILILKANGCTNKMIAKEFRIRPDSVSTKLTRLYRLLGAENGIHAVAVCLKLGLINPEQISIRQGVEDTVRAA